MDAAAAGYREAIGKVVANKSPRFRRLEAIESWLNGTQYAGRVSWWDDSKPLWERAPCITYPIVRLAASSNVDLMLGERAFPRFVFEGQKKEGADESDASPIDAVLDDIHRLSRWRTTCRDAFTSAQGCGTACAVYGARGGRLFGDLVPAKWCTPKFSEGFTVSELEIRYPFIDEVRKQNGEWEAVAKIYRRVISDTADTVYKPAEAPDDDGAEVAWAVDKEKTVEHNLGFCPVVWYPFMRGAAAVNVIDGKAIHAGLTDDIQAHDIARSQWHKTALYTDPQIIEIGVEPGYNPTGSVGRTAIVATTEHGGEAHPDGNPIRGHFHAGKPKSARKKGPGHLWQYSNPETKVQNLTTPGDALVSQKDNVADLRIKLQESLAVVFLDPENIKFAATTSGKALEAIKQKQFDRVDQYREDFRDGFLLPSLAMQLRIVQKLGLKIKGIEALASISPDDIETSCTVQWGSYQAPDFAEQKSIIELVQLALGGNGGTPLVDLKTAIQKLKDSDIFEIEDEDELIDRIQQEADERQDRAMKNVEAQAGLKGPEPGDKEPSGERPPAPGKGKDQ